jgi:hypothetical protein
MQVFCLTAPLFRGRHTCGRSRSIMTQTVNRSEIRFSPSAGQTLPVSVLKDDSQTPISAEVMDISPSGAKLVVSLPLKTDDIVTVQLSFLDTGVELQCPGRIRWVRLARDFRWLAGVMFDEAISVEQLKKLAGVGYIEQRGAPRTDVQIPSTARRETLIDDIRVAITNLSATGFRLSSPEHMEPGERVLVGTESADGDVEFPAHVRWSGPQQDRFAVGCEFINKDSFRYLSHHLPEEVSDSWTKPLLPGRCSWVLGAALTIALAAWQCRAELPHVADHAERAWQTCSSTVQSLI